VRSRLLAALGWMIVTPLLVLLFTQSFENGTGVTALVVGQTLMPYAAPFAIPVGVAALVSRRRALAAASAIAVAGTAWIAAPLVWHPDPPEVDRAAPTLTVAYANLYWQTPTAVLAADALMDTLADVLVMSEFTPRVAEALDALGGLDAYPYRAGGPSTTPDGLAIWSRFPLVDVSLAPIGPTPGVEATVEIGRRSLRVITSHPDPPVPGGRVEAWVPSLRALNERARDDGASDDRGPDDRGPDDRAPDDGRTGTGARSRPVPTLVVADVNASWWHPPYRRVLADGLIDVHQVLGDGFSTSWPADRSLIPPFTRIDHALVRGPVQPLGIDDLTIPGSDHEGFVVRLAIGR
jgi:endonuclease/exonuclease/phosphatase (EEP) superfamily protein YafD